MVCIKFVIVSRVFEICFRGICYPFVNQITVQCCTVSSVLEQCYDKSSSFVIKQMYTIISISEKLQYQRRNGQGRLNQNESKVKSCIKKQQGSRTRFFCYT